MTATTDPAWFSRELELRDDREACCGLVDICAGLCISGALARMLWTGRFSWGCISGV